MSTVLFVHVALSLVGIASGLVVAYGLLTGKRLDGWTTLFLVTTVATSVTGFGLPADRILPSHILAVLSLIALAVAIVARYPRRLAGGWRTAYVIGAMLSLYFNVFVGVVQAFQKIPALNALAPTQAEPPFAIAQLLVLVLFIGLTVVAVRRFRHTAGRTRPAVALS